VRDSLRVSAVVRTVAGGEAVVSAPAPGRFTGSVPPVGSRVAEGQPLGQIEPRLEGLDDVTTLEAAVTTRRLEVLEARNELARADLLVSERAVPARRLETARHELDTARAELRAAEARLESRLQTLTEGGSPAGRNAFVLRAPIAGTVIAADATPGAAYDAGAPLFRIVRTDLVVVEAQVPESDAPATTRIASAVAEMGRATEPYPLDVRAVRHAGRIDPETRALPVWLEVGNRSGRLLIGQTLTAALYSDEHQQRLAVPASAVLTDAGQTIVFVQAGGETFERRLVRTGPRDGDLVAVVAGLQPGDRVVTRAAYDVLLAAAMPARAAAGHVH
jgi:RND family efflux transporter MFP subunit